MSYFLYLGIIIGCGLVLVSLIMPAAFYQYSVVSLIGGVLLIALCFFQYGRLVEVEKYEKQTLINNAHIAELETKSAVVDTKIITEYVDKIKYVDRIKEIKTDVYITKEDDSGCVISASTSDSITRMLNDASKGILPETPR